MAKSAAAAKTPQGQRLLIAIAAMIVMGLVYWLAFYRGVAEDFDNATLQTTQLQREESEWATKQSTYRSDIEELNRRRARSREQVKILPIEADMDAFLDNLNSIAELSGLQIQSTEPEPPSRQEGFYERLPVKLEIRGRYYQIAKFLFNIGRVERIINMENIALSDPAVVDTDVILKAKVLATTFRALTEAEMNPADGAAAPATPTPPGG